MKRMVTMTLINNDATTGGLIKTNVAVRDMLEALGWQYDGNCNCGGQYSDKYKMAAGEPGQVHEVKIRRTSFLYKGPRTSKFTKYPLALLKSTVDEIEKLNK